MPGLAGGLPALFESLIVARALHAMNFTLNLTDIAWLESYVAIMPSESAPGCGAQLACSPDRADAGLRTPARTPGCLPSVSRAHRLPGWRNRNSADAPAA